MSKLNQLKVLDFASNELSGSVPNGFALLTACESMDLSKNDLLGSVPASIAHLNNLQFFSAEKNVRLTSAFSVAKGTVRLEDSQFSDLLYNPLS